MKIHTEFRERVAGHSYFISTHHPNYPFKNNTRRKGEKGIKWRGFGGGYNLVRSKSLLLLGEDIGSHTNLYNGGQRKKEPH